MFEMIMKAVNCGKCFQEPQSWRVFKRQPDEVCHSGFWETEDPAASVRGGGRGERGDRHRRQVNLTLITWLFSFFCCLCGYFWLFNLSLMFVPSGSCPTSLCQCPTYWNNSLITSSLGLTGLNTFKLQTIHNQES